MGEKKAKMEETPSRSHETATPTGGPFMYKRVLSLLVVLCAALCALFPPAIAEEAGEIAFDGLWYIVKICDEAYPELEFYAK